MAQPQCRVCSKFFVSAKAVDGHMRVHTPEERRLVKKQLKKRAAFRLRATKKRRNPSTEFLAPTAQALLHFSALSIPEEAVTALLDLSRRIQALRYSEHFAPAVQMKPRSASEEAITTVEERSAVATSARRKKKTITPAKPSGDEYGCSKCSRVFFTAHALGGHRGKHCQQRHLENLELG